SEALARWEGTGVDISGLRTLEIRIVDLPGPALGLASGHTIWLDANAAGWGWFVDQSPWDDSEFTTPGNQGEQQRMDLVTVLEHEVGHLLGRGHEADGLMAASLAPGTRETPGGGAPSPDLVVTLAWAEVWTDPCLGFGLAQRRR